MLPTIMLLAWLLLIAICVGHIEKKGIGTAIIDALLIIAGFLLIEPYLQ